MRREVHEPPEVDDLLDEWRADDGGQQADRPGVIHGYSDIKPMSTFGEAEVNCVIDGLLIEGTLNLITSESGDGKTTLVSEMAYRVSMGQPFAGRPTSKRPVLVLDRENPRAAMLAMFGRLAISEHDDFRVWGGWQPEDPPSPDASLILCWIAACDPRPLIILDSLVAFHPGAENDATETRAFLHRLRKLASLGGTVVVLHHVGKSESSRNYRGSSDIPAAIDLGLRISNHSEVSGRLGRLEVKAFKDRFGLFTQTEFTYVDGGFYEVHAAHETNTDRLIELLKRNPGTQKTAFSDLAKAAGLGRNRAKNFLESFARRGAIHVETGAHNARFFTWSNGGSNGLF